MQNIYKSNFLVYILLIHSCQNDSWKVSVKGGGDNSSSRAEISNSNSRKKDFKNSENLTILAPEGHSSKNDKDFNQKKSSIDKYCVVKSILGLAVLGVLIFLVIYCSELKNERNDLKYQVEGLQNQLYDLQNALNSSTDCARELVTCKKEKDSFSKSLLELSASTSNNEKSYKECLNSSVLCDKDLELSKNEKEVCSDKFTQCSSDLEFSKNFVNNYVSLLNDCHETILKYYGTC